MNITNSNLLKNIDYQRTKLNIRIDDLEKSIGVSTGYLSNLSKDLTSFPSLDVIIRLSDVLKISIDLLLKSDCTIPLTDSDKIILNFLNYIKENTISRHARWKKESFGLGITPFLYSSSLEKYGANVYTNGFSRFLELDEKKILKIEPRAINMYNNRFCFVVLNVKDIELEKSTEIANGLLSHPYIVETLNELCFYIDKMDGIPEVEHEMIDYLNSYLVERKNEQ